MLGACPYGRPRGWPIDGKTGIQTALNQFYHSDERFGSCTKVQRTRAECLVGLPSLSLVPCFELCSFEGTREKVALKFITLPCLQRVPDF